MPLLTNTIDDKSPLISYGANWLPGSAWDDVFASLYYLGTFTTNNVTNGEAATFTFNGTGVWIYGANRPNHGNYTIQLDGASNVFHSSANAGGNLFQICLFNKSALSQATHTVQLTNIASDNLYVDIDMIVWQSQVGSADDRLVSEIIQDTDSRFQYWGPAWSSSTTSNINFALFQNGTGQVWFSSSALAGAAEALPGEAINLYGTTGPSNGQYSVQLDGGTTTQYNATNAYPTNYDIVIYHANNLGPGSHTLVLTNIPAASGQALTIDYAKLWTTVSSPPNSGVVSSHKPGPGEIAGIVVVIIAAVISIGVVFSLYWRWRAALATQQDLYRDRAYTLQKRPPGSATVAPTRVSSSSETRYNANLSQTDPAPQQVDSAAPIVTGSRDSQSMNAIIATAIPSARFSSEEGGRRQLPEAPGGDQPMSREPRKLGNAQRPPSASTVNRNSITPGESEAPPPNYDQATGNELTTER